jgi:hypothetical protein
MAQATLAVNAGAGTLLDYFSRSKNGNTVLVPSVWMDEHPGAMYFVPTGSGVSLATAASHPIEVMAGASLPLYVRRIVLYQVGLATTASTTDMIVGRLSSAGTGGTVLGVSAIDSTDAAAGMTGMSLPTGKGTEAASSFWRGQVYLNQTLPTFAAGEAMKILDLDFDKLRTKVPRIAAGTSNGIYVKNISAIAAATITAIVYATEWNY